MSRARASRGRSKAGNWLSRHWRGLFGAVAAVIVLAGIYIGWTLHSAPDLAHQSLLGQTIVVYDVKGRVIEERNPEGAFYVVLSLPEMGKYGPAATLASEDRHFYTEGALDYGAIIRSFFTDLKCQCYSQGGSTITQQLVKIEVLSPQKSIFRKMQEAALAEALSHQFSKDKILELYLNRVYYGHGAYGLGAATKTYFGKDKNPSDLDAAQAAFLAGLVQAPYYYDPQLHYDLAHQRALYVLDGMAKLGVITPAEEQQAAAEDIQKELKFDTSYRLSKAPHFVDYVLTKLESQLGAATVQQGGFAVYTTLDLDLQALAEKSVASGVKQLDWGNVNNGDLLAANPKTGAILAWVGSSDYYNDKIGGQFDVVTAARQPGSSFKVYTYESALRDHQITLADVLKDTPHDFDGYKPQDWDNNFDGPMSARHALVESRNVPAVETGSKEGIPNVISFAQEMGIKTKLDPSLPTAIGSSDVTMFDNLQGYQVFADQGHKMPLMAITKVVDRDNNTLFEATPGQQDGQTNVITPAEAYLITDVLKRYQDVWDLGWERQMAGKSGTSNGNETGANRDAWMMAYNPNIVVGAWGGNTVAQGGGQSISAFGVNVGQTVLQEFINGLPANMRDWYSQPDGLDTGPGCPGMDDAKHELFLPGTKPDCAGLKPSPTPTPSPAAPSPSPIALPPSPSPIIRILPSPSPTPNPTASP
ncbi:MAG TPA: transglycosylase domain-containing protein [Candidatus Dormibacteraeota bacterium]